MPFVIPGPAEGRSPESIRRSRSTWHGLCDPVLLRCMDSGFARSRSRPGMTKRNARAPSPLFFAARGEPSSPLGSPEGSGAPRNAGACEAPLSGWRGRPTRLRGVPSPFPESRLSALHWRRFLSPGPRFLVPAQASSLSAAPVRLIALSRRGLPRTLGATPVQQSSLRRGRSAPRSGPGTSRARGYEPRPRAPHPPPPS